MFEHLLVPLDGSRLAEAALPAGRQAYVVYPLIDAGDDEQALIGLRYALAEIHDQAGDAPAELALYRAVREVSVPVTSGILIIIIVFLPLLTLQGLEGKLFVPVALTIVFALTASLVLSLTAVPVLASYLLGKPAHEDPWLVRRLNRLYSPLLSWSLNHTRTVVSIAVFLLVAAGALYTQVGKAFMPSMDEGDIIVQLEKLPSINLEKSIDLDQRVLAAEHELRQRLGQRRVVTEPQVTSQPNDRQ